MRFIKVHIKELLRWLYWGPVRALARLMPRAVSYRLMHLVGLVACTLMRGKRARLMQWIGRVRPDTPGGPGKGALRAFVHYYKNSLDTLLYSRLNRGNIEGAVSYEGLEHLEEALKAGKGAIILYPHFGNEEFLMPAFGHKIDTPVHQVASRWEPEYFEGPHYALANAIRRHAFRMRIGTREALPVGFVYVDKGVREAYRLLAKNNILLIALDGREGKGWVEAEYLRGHTLLSTGPMKLAASTGAAVLPAIITRTGLYRHTLKIMQPLAEVTEQNMESQLRQAVAALEPFMLTHVAQYAKFLLLDVKLFKEDATQ